MNSPSVTAQEASTAKNVGDWVIYRRLLGYALPYIGLFLVSMVGFALYGAMQTMAADILQLILDAFGQTPTIHKGIISTYLKPLLVDSIGMPSDSRWVIVVALMLVTVVRGIGFFLGNFFMAQVGRNTVHSVRCDLFSHVVRLPISYFDNNNVGFLVSRVTYNTDQITSAITKALTLLLREGFSIVCLMGYLIYVNWKLTLSFIVVAPFIALIVSVTAKRFRRISKNIQNSMGEVSHVTNEAMSGNRLMRIFGGEAYETERFARASNRNMRHSVKEAATSGAYTPALELLITAALSALIWFALDPEFAKSMSPGSVAAFIGAAAMLAKPMRQLSGVMGMMQKGLAAAQDIFEQIDQPLERDEGTHEVARVKGRIEVRNLNFRYGDDLPYVLRDINFVVEAGKSVALVGSSGSGKSTLVSLLARFYEYHEGSILFDDVDIREYKLANLRSQIALVNQQVVLFNDTVHRNIAYGVLQHASREAVEKAAELAYAKDFIQSQENGFDTLVGDNGVKLSGGQRQRIAIARALLKDAPILILDEATSALDNESERAIQLALEKVMQNRTTFVIAHRLSTIENADLILVMEHGRIVESGNHQALLQHGGRYAQLHQRQFSDEAPP